MDILLNDVEARILGCLIEKKIATPDYYPITLNGLTHACNQKSNRNPVVDFDEKTVVRGLDSLREKKLSGVFYSAGSRVPKYEHNIERVLGTDEPETAILCELLVRGPQTFGELRSRASRLHEFATVDDVAEVIDSLMSREDGPMVVQLPRQSGRKEHRYAHLLCGQPAAEEEDVEAPVEAARVVVQAEEERIAKLEEQVESLWRELSALREEYETFREQFE